MSTILVPLLVAALQSPCGWDLASSWSETANPNGPWSFNAGAAPIATLQPDWIGSGNPAWAAASSGFGHIPAWGRVTAAGAPAIGPDAIPGTIFVHGNDPMNGTDVDLANVTWTSPINTPVRIRCAFWHTDAHAGRSADWRLYHNGTLLGTGNLADGDAYGPLAPRYLDIPRAVAAGDVIRLEFQRTSFFGTFVCLQMAISRSALFLRSPIPGVAGQNSTFEIRGAQPNGRVGLAYSSATGSFSLPGCSISGCLQSPRLAALLTADAAGLASFTAAVPPSLAGRTLHFQAGEPGACQVSNAVTHEF